MVKRPYCHKQKKRYLCIASLDRRCENGEKVVPTVPEMNVYQVKSSAWVQECPVLCTDALQIYIMPKAKSSVEIKNRRASFDYEFIETFQAGIVLTGTEIKSIRAGKASLVDAFCYFNRNELYVKNMHVAEYWWGSWGKHDPRRDRKLLLSRKELNKLQRAVKEKGLTIVGVKLYIADNGYAKLLIALARGKKEFDKRASIKEKDLRREMERI